MAVVITATEQDVWPPRVLVSVTGLTLGDDIEVYRVVTGSRTLVRTAAAVDVTDTAFLRVDAELPFGVPVSYVAVVNSTEYATAPVTYVLEGGKVALTDPIGGGAAELVILAWDEKDWSRPSTVFVAGGRNIVVSGPTPGFTATLEAYVDAVSGSDSLESLLRGATSGVVQIRQAGPYDRVDAYVAVPAFAEKRWSQDGSDGRRIWRLDLVEVDGWAAALESPGWTLEDLGDLYTGQTLNDLSGDYTTLLQLAQSDLGA